MRVLTEFVRHRRSGLGAALLRRDPLLGGGPARDEKLRLWLLGPAGGIRVLVPGVSGPTLTDWRTERVAVGLTRADTSPPRPRSELSAPRPRRLVVALFRRLSDDDDDCRAGRFLPTTVRPGPAAP